MLKALLKTMRPRQWTKNAFVLAAIVFDGQIINAPAVLRSLLGVALFCLLSSAIYIINDLADIEADRAHPKKRNRPIASGRLPVRVAILATIVLLLISLVGAALLSLNFLWIALIYLITNLAYSKWLKHIPLIDVLILASGFVLRVGAGVSIIEVQRFSPWLYVVTTLLALYLGFGKRRAELTLLEGEANSHRRVLSGYTIPLLDQFITIVSGTTIVSYSLYTFSAPNLPSNHSMMLTIPFVIYGIFRYLYLIQVEKAGGEPEEMLLSDRPLQATIVLWGLTVVLFLYVLK